MGCFHDEISIGDVHQIHQYEFADAAARTGASGFVTADEGKVARQLDNDSFWVLNDPAPTWGPLSASALIAATTVTDETLLNSAPAVGTDLDYAREDHTHGSPSSSTIAAAVDYDGRFEGTSIGTGDITLNHWGWWWDTVNSRMMHVRNRLNVLYGTEANPL